jgi:hypothetical protein
MKASIHFRYRTLLAFATVAITGALGIASAADTYQISNHTLANSGGTVRNDCFSLSSTIGEPVAGTVSSNGPYRLTAGFQAATTNPLTVDTLFKNGFDNQPKDCTP